MKYSKWRGGFRKRMEKKGLQKTKATEIMVEFDFSIVSVPESSVAVVMAGGAACEVTP